MKEMIPLLRLSPLRERLHGDVMPIINSRFTEVMRGSVSSTEEFQLDAFARGFDHWNRK